MGGNYFDRIAPPPRSTAEKPKPRPSGRGASFFISKVLHYIGYPHQKNTQSDDIDKVCLGIKRARKYHSKNCTEYCTDCENIQTVHGMKPYKIGCSNVGKYQIINTKNNISEPRAGQYLVCGSIG